MKTQDSKLQWLDEQITAVTHLLNSQYYGLDHNPSHPKSTIEPL